MAGLIHPEAMRTGFPNYGLTSKMQKLNLALTASTNGRTIAIGLPPAVAVCGVLRTRYEDGLMRRVIQVNRWIDTGFTKKPYDTSAECIRSRWQD